MHRRSALLLLALAASMALLGLAPAQGPGDVPGGVSVLSGGAVEPGILAAAGAFQRASGAAVAVRFGTAPDIRRRVEGGEAADVLVVPAALAEALTRAGVLRAEGAVRVGRVGVGVAVREGFPAPRIDTPEAFRRAVSEAEAVVFNTASTGLYLDTLFERMGLAETIRARAVRYPTGEAVLEHLRRGTGREIGLGALTEIMLYRHKGIALAGPLPAELQNSTLYVAAPAVRGTNGADAARFLAFLAGAEGAALFRAAGIEE